MQYLLTAKNNLIASASRQYSADEKETLNIVRKFMLSIQSMDETSADLKAIAFMASVEPNGARAIENQRTKMVLIVQQHKESA